MAYSPIVDEGTGGGNTPPVAPKGYTPTTPIERTSWNNFLDYAGKANVDFDKNPQAAANLMAQYKKTNPDFPLTPNDVQRIQYEQYQLRKGDKFNDLGPEQLKYLRQGLPDTYLNRPIPDANGQFNTATAKLYYPQKTAGNTNYGTDIESYVKGVGGQPVASPAPVVAPTVSIKGAVPLPDYDDPKSRDNYLSQFGPKYGKALIQGRGDTIIHVNEVPEGGTLTAKESATQAASKFGLDPALLYASAMEEGMSGMYKGKDGKYDASNSDKYPVDGFHNYGLDNFHDQFPTLVKKGYLPKDFDYEKAVNKDESGRSVNSANFKTPEDAMQAKAAYVKMEQDDIDDYAKKKGVDLSPKARQFFTLINFNGGEGTGHKMIDYYAKKGLLDGDKFLTTKPEPGQRLGQSWGNVTPRLAMAGVLKKEGLFP